MKLARTSLGWVGIALVSIGYAASQCAFFNGTPSQHAAAFDTMPIRILAGLVFLGAVLSAVSKQEGNE